MKKIPLCRPSINDNEIKSIVEALKSGWITHGPKNRELEESVYRREQLQVKIPDAGNRVISSHVWH